MADQGPAGRSRTTYCRAWKAVVLSAWDHIIAGCTLDDGHTGEHYDARQGVEWPQREAADRASSQAGGERG